MPVVNGQAKLWAILWRAEGPLISLNITAADATVCLLLKLPNLIVTQGALTAVLS